MIPIPSPAEAWLAISTDRLAFAEYLGSCPPAAWNQPSLCSEWQVRDVVAHLVAMASDSKWRGFTAYVGARANLDHTNANLLSEVKQRHSDDDLRTSLRDTASSTMSPPGLKPRGVLGELLVHILDVTVALDQPLDLPADHLIIALEYLRTRVRGNTRFNLLGLRRQPVLHGAARCEGLTLRATDLDWCSSAETSSGDFPLVEGPASLLLLALAGRPAALTGLTGDGVHLLAAR